MKFIAIFIKLFIEVVSPSTHETISSTISKNPSSLISALRASFRRLTFPDGSDFVVFVVVAATIAIAPEVRGAPYDFPDGHGHLLYVTSQGEE